MTKSVAHPMRPATYLRVALAMATPSWVDVPLPSSSSTMRERAVARRMISLVRASSTMKVDCEEGREGVWVRHRGVDG